MTAMVSPYIIPGKPSIDDIVASHFGITVVDMRERTRKREIVEARQYSMWFKAEHTRMSFRAIAEYYSGLDHATVHHAKKTVLNLMQTDKFFRQKALMAYAALERAGYTSNITRSEEKSLKTYSYE